MADRLALAIDTPVLATPAPTSLGRAGWWTARLDTTVQQGVVAIFDQAVVSATTFLTSVIIGHLGSRDMLGVYYLAYTVVLLVLSVQERMISTPYMIYCARRSGDALASYTGSSLAYQLMLSALVGVGLLGFMLAGAAGAGRADLTVVAAALLGAMPFILLRWFVRLVSIAHLRMLTTTVFDTVIAIVQLGGLLLLGYFHLLSVPAAYLVIGAACAVACLGWFLTKEQPLRFVRAELRKDWRRNWAFGKWVLASNLVGSVAGYAIPWIVTAAHGKAATGLLAACATLAGVANMFMASLDGLITSKAARAFSTGGVPRLVRVLGRATLLFAVVVGAFCLLFMVAGEPLVAFVYGPEYTGAGVVAAVLAFGILVNAIGNNAGRGLWVIERPRANLVPDLCSLVVTVAVLFYLLPLGPLGAAIATLAGSLAGGFTRFWAFGAALRAIPQRL